MQGAAIYTVEFGQPLFETKIFESSVVFQELRCTQLNGEREKVHTLVASSTITTMVFRNKLKTLQDLFRVFLFRRAT